MPQTEALFRQSSVKRLSSPEKLDDYIRVSNPSVWLVLGAVAILLACVLVWGVFGAVQTSLTQPFVSSNGMLVAYFTPEKAASLTVGMPVDVGGTPGVICEISTSPLSRAEAAEQLSGDYAAFAMGLSEWNVRVAVSSEAKLQESTFSEVKIMTESVRPIDFLTN